MKANMKLKSDPSVAPDGDVAVGKLPLEQAVLLWRLHTGGITDHTLLRRITGINAHGMAVRGAITSLDRALTESFPIREYVRCRKCGGLLCSIPCVQCGPGCNSYVFTGKVVPNAGE